MAIRTIETPRMVRLMTEDMNSLVCAALRTAAGS
jgi:hypothetical protein